MGKVGAGSVERDVRFEDGREALPGPLAVDVVRRIDYLSQLATAWNALLASSRTEALFLTWEWISAWWEVYGGGKRQLYVLLIHGEQGRLVGIAPFMIEKVRLFGVWPTTAVRFIGDGGDVTPEYLNVFAAPGYESAVLDACLKHLRGDRSIGFIDLRPVVADSPARHHVEQSLRTWRGLLWTLDDSINPVLPLPPSVEAFLDSRSRNYRKKIGEYERRCQRVLGASLRVSRNAAELTRDMETLEILHRKRWRGLSRAFDSPQYRTFHQKLAARMLQRRWLRLFILESPETPLAALYCFSDGNRYYFYQGGRDPAFDRHRVGLVLMHKVIQEAILDGARTFDFLSGDEAYKYRWATKEIRSVRVVYCRSRIAGLALRGYHKLRGFRDRGRALAALPASIGAIMTASRTAPSDPRA